MFKTIRALLALAVTMVGLGTGMVVSAVVCLLCALLKINLLIGKEKINDIAYKIILTVTASFAYIAALIDREAVKKLRDEAAHIYDYKQSKY